MGAPVFQGCVIGLYYLSTDIDNIAMKLRGLG